MSFPKVFAHRGLRNEYPENTLPAIDAAIKLPKISGVEFDVELSDVPVVLHQETMVPNENFTALQLATRDFESRDWVSEYQGSAIMKLDAGIWKGDEFSGQTVPGLDQVLALDWGDVQANVELKDPSFWGAKNVAWPNRIVTAVADSLRKFDCSKQIISFNPEIIRAVKRELPELPSVLAIWTEWQGRGREAILLAKDAGASTLSLADVMIVEENSWVQMAHDAGLEISAYPVSPAFDEPQFASWNPEARKVMWDKLIRLEVDTILSDFPRDLLTHLYGKTK